MRGGVSKEPFIIPPLVGSSPHAWGCFLDAAGLMLHDVVFPTCVGVFPITPS